MSMILQQTLDPIVGLPLRHLGRDGRTFNAHFGEFYRPPVSEEDTEVFCDWMLAVWCPWRITKPGRIEIASLDFDDSWRDDDLGDPDRDGSRFDFMAYLLHKEFWTKPPIVEEITQDDVGGFSISLSKGYRFAAFPADSEIMLERSFWRLTKSEVNERGRRCR